VFAVLLSYVLFPPNPDVFPPDVGLLAKGFVEGLKVGLEE
jgi:hypothetical protein